MIENLAGIRGPGRWLWRVEDGVLFVLMSALLLLSFSQIVSRNLFDHTILWADPLIRHLVLWASFLGALIATREDKHIRIDALWRILPAPARCLTQFFTSLFAAGTCSILCWIAVRFVSDERAFGDLGFLGIPIWILGLIFPLTFGLMALRLYNSAARGLLSMVERAPH